MNIGKVFFTTASTLSFWAAAPFFFARPAITSVHTSATKISIVVRTSFTLSAPWKAGSPIIA